MVIRKFDNRVSAQTVNWIGCGKFTWINTDNSPFRFINHSCAPNAAIKGERTVYALRALQAREEITIDYSLNEMEKGWRIPRCNCRSLDCRSQIGPLISLPPEIYAKKAAYISRKFREIYLRESRAILS